MFQSMANAFSSCSHCHWLTLDLLRVDSFSVHSTSNVNNDETIFERVLREIDVTTK